MQFLISVIEGFPLDGRRVVPGGSATDDEQAAIEAVNQKMIDAGWWIFAGGLSAPADAAVLDGRAGAGASASAAASAESAGPLLSPTARDAEHYGGFWVVDVPDAAAAHALALEASAACNRRVELRPLL